MGGYILPPLTLHNTTQILCTDVKAWEIYGVLFTVQKREVREAKDLDKLGKLAAKVLFIILTIPIAAELAYKCNH